MVRGIYVRFHKDYNDYAKQTGLIRNAHYSYIIQCICTRNNGRELKTDCILSRLTLKNKNCSMSGMPRKIADNSAWWISSLLQLGQKQTKNLASASAKILTPPLDILSIFFILRKNMYFLAAGGWPPTNNAIWCAPLGIHPKPNVYNTSASIYAVSKINSPMPWKLIIQNYATFLVSIKAEND